MNRKGMSKTIGLIVTASVLLMTAAIVIFMTQGGLEDVFKGSSQESCATQISTKCQFGADSFPAPEACEDANFDPSSVDNVADGTLEGTIECEQSDSGE